MGSYNSRATVPDKKFLHENGHKTYVVTSSHMDFIKIGYTRQPITNGVWSVYRRAYGEDLEIIRVYPASRYKEDDLIHAKLHEEFGIPHKGREIYYKKHRKALIVQLDSWHEAEGLGPFKRVDILTMKAEAREKSPKSASKAKKPQEKANKTKTTK